MYDTVPFLPAEDVRPDLAALPSQHEISRPTTSNRVDETEDVCLDQPPEIDRFTLLQRLGAGGFGTVWKAHDQLLDRTVAIKMPRAPVPDERQVRRFLQEARLASQLHHPGIVAVHEVGRSGTSLYIVADFVEGETLTHWLARHERTPQQLARVCQALAEAMEHAHRAGVIHRDLKPSNILIDRQDQPHITDFGLARRISDHESLTEDGHVVGTPAYMSPEQIRGTQPLDGRADVYALGVILYEMLTGEVPFRGTVQMMIHDVLQGEPRRVRELSSHVPRDLENICSKCLEKDRRQRYASAHELAADLTRFLHGQVVVARATPWYVRTWRWCKRNRLLSSVVVLLPVVLLAGLLATTRQWMRAESLAASEAQARAELEQLTEQILDLAIRIQRLESPSPEERAFTQQAVQDPVPAKFDALVRFAPPHALAHFVRGKDPATATDGEVGPSQSLGENAAIRLQTPPPTHAVTRRVVTSPIPAQRVDLRMDAELSIARLAKLSPALAQQCRSLLPERPAGGRDGK